MPSSTEDKVPSPQDSDKINTDKRMADFPNGLNFEIRAKLSDAVETKPRRRRVPVEPAPVRAPTEEEIRKEAAWKQVEETGKPLLLDDTLLLPQGMSLWKSFEYLPDGLGQEATVALEHKMGDILEMQLRSAKEQIREQMKEQGELEAYDALPEIGKSALAETLVRQQWGLPEVPLEEIIDRMQKDRLPSEDEEKKAKKPRG